jgi:hypothetical protein
MKTKEILQYQKEHVWSLCILSAFLKKQKAVFELKKKKKKKGFMHGSFNKDRSSTWVM